MKIHLLNDKSMMFLFLLQDSWRNAVTVWYEKNQSLIHSLGVGWSERVHTGYCPSCVSRLSGMKCTNLVDKNDAKLWKWFSSSLKCTSTPQSHQSKTAWMNQRQTVTHTIYFFFSSFTKHYFWNQYHEGTDTISFEIQKQVPINELSSNWP